MIQKSPSLLLAAALALTLPLLTRADNNVATNIPPAADTPSLQQFSHQSQSLYKKIAGSLIRVKFDNPVGSAAMHDFPQLQKEFDDWRQKQSPNSPGARREHPNRPRAGAGSPTTMPARGPGSVGALRRFIEQKLKETSDAPTQTRLRNLLARLESARAGQPAGASEFTGILLDDQGNALVAWGTIRQNPGATFRVTEPDGTEISAKYVGAHLGRGLAIIKLESSGGAGPITFAGARPEPGELLLCLTSRQRSLGWIVAPPTDDTPATASDKSPDERFPIFASENRGAAYLFNTSGELSAIGIDKFAIPIDVVKDDIQWIIKHGKDISPKRFGVKYDPVLPDLRRTIPDLGEKAAVLVREVQPNSPADKAGLKKGDILLTIDDVSVGLYPQLQLDLATRTGNVPIGIIRDNQEKTLQMPLDEK